MRLTLPILGVVAVALAACTGRDSANPETETPAAPSEQAATEVPPATAPATAMPAANPAPPEQGPMPAPGTIGYAGFGPAKFGVTAEQVRMAWGKEMVGGPGEPGSCYYLYPQPRPQNGYRIAFMIEGDKFVRVDVDTAGIAAPGGGEVGQSIDEIRKRYAGAEEQPHKYVEGGKNVRHKDASGSVVLFETDAAGKVTEWRVGLPPQVDYVEGCG